MFVDLLFSCIYQFVPFREFKGSDRSMALAREVLAGKPSAARDIIVLNSAAGIVAHRLSKNPAERDRSFVERMSEAVKVAQHSIDSGAASAKLDAWVAATN